MKLKMLMFIGIAGLLLVVFATGARAAEKKYTEPSTGMQFVWVPGGCYMMGDVFLDDQSVYNQQPAHEVCVDSFFMGKYEVTQGEWTEIMENNPSRFFGERRPVEEVSWNDVQAFITKLNAKTGKQYRLPTEAEWEYAARSGGKKEKWPGTSNKKELGNYAWLERRDSGHTTHPVGQKKPNHLGLFDMYGNVAEWCSDFEDDLIYESDWIRKQAINPMGPSQGIHSMSYGHVIRGVTSYNPFEFNWNYVTYRSGNTPDFRGYSDNSGNSFGFRLVLSPATTVERTRASGYKSAEQIMEYASKVENFDAVNAKERAIKMYQTIIDIYPDSKQAKMIKGRPGVLQNRINEERETEERLRQEQESRRANERYNANSGNRLQCEAQKTTCLSQCGSNYGCTMQCNNISCN